MVMKGKVELLALFLIVVCGGLVSGDDASLQKDCANLITKMTNCLQFATGKSNTPTKECCTSVTEVKDFNPACLCFFIQQVHKGDANLKSLGLQEASLLQLPSACKLTNATSVIECPRFQCTASKIRTSLRACWRTTAVPFLSELERSHLIHGTS